MNYNDNYPKHFVEKYNNIPYVFLDIPRIVPDDNFMELWETYKIPVLRKVGQHDAKYPFTPEEAQIEFERVGRTNEYTQPNWLGCYALDSKNADQRWTRSVFDGPKLLPKFFEQIYDLLPIRYISQILFWSNQRNIGTHRDLHEQYNWPSSIRMMITDENPQPTLFLVPIDPETPANALSGAITKDFKELSTAKFVDTTKYGSNVFMYNNRQWAHGAKKIQGYSKILCSMSIDYDWKKLEVLLDRSIAKYGNNLP